MQGCIKVAATLKVPPLQGFFATLHVQKKLQQSRETLNVDIRYLTK